MASTVLILCPSPLSSRLSGPAIRYREFAKELSRNTEVTLAAPEADLSDRMPFRTETYNQRSISQLVQNHEIVLIQGFVLAEYPEIAEQAQYLVVDLYDPYPLEDLTIIPASSLGKELYRATLASILIQVLSGDFFLCASERQRDFWLGTMLAMGRINPATYQQDKTLGHLIEIVPFGLPDESPKKTNDVIKGVIPGIKKKDKVLIWGGGIYNWLDPTTPIKAMKEVSDKRDDIKLFFMGSANIGQTGVATDTAQDARRLAAELSLENRSVFFNSNWVPYEQRANYLLEADAGISAHPNHLESHFSFRTRILDYIWTGLPVIATRGDATSDLIHSYRLGRTVDPDNPQQFCNAILSLFDENDFSHYKEHAKQVAQKFSWKNVVQPFVRYCSNPSKATDKEFYGKSFTQAMTRNLLKDKSLLAAGWHSLREEGWESFLNRAKSYLGRKAKQ